MSRSYATILSKLCHDYANRRLSFTEYRNRRRALLEKIDEQFNGPSDSYDGDLTSPGLSASEFGLASLSRNPNNKPH